MRATPPFDVQEDCLPLVVPSALESAHPSPFMHLAPVLFEFLPLLVLRSSPLLGPAWLHCRCGALHQPNELPPGQRVGSGGCLARGQ